MNPVKEFIYQLPEEERRQFESPVLGGEEWPEPMPLKESELRPVTQMPKTLIPKPLRSWLTDISYRMQCPLDFVAVGAMVAISSLVGAGCGIRPKQNDDWTVIPNLWGGVIARPSMKKSPALGETMKPINRLEVTAKEGFEQAEQFASADKELYKATKAAIISDMTAVLKSKSPKSGKTVEVLRCELASLEEPQATIRRRYKTSDATVEKLGELMNENPRGILVFRDELTGLLTSWEREDKQSDRAFFLEAWNGNQPYTTDRIGRGTIDIKNCCLTILGGIQPSKLMAYLLQAANSLQNDGMIQRFQLLVYPDEPKDWKLVDEKPDKTARDIALEVYEKLANMDFIGSGACDDGDKPYFHFGNEAQQVFYEWLTDLQSKKTSEENPLMCEHLGKYDSLMPALSLLFQLIDMASGEEGGSISKENAEKAAAWCDYLEGHARRIYGLLSDAKRMAAISLAKRISNGDIQDGFTVRDVYRNGWSLLDTKERAEDACNELVEMNWLISKMVEVVNRPRSQEKYFINPKIQKNIKNA